MHWYLRIVTNYFGIEGRASREEFWMFALANVAIFFVLGFVDDVVDTGLLLGMVFVLAVFIPSIAISIRRLHDVDRSGWWMLVAFLPIVGQLVLLAFAASEGTRGSNRYGPDPKADEGGLPAIV